MLEEQLFHFRFYIENNKFYLRDKNRSYFFSTIKLTRSESDIYHAHYGTERHLE